MSPNMPIKKKKKKLLPGTCLLHLREVRNKLFAKKLKDSPFACDELLFVSLMVVCIFLSALC